MGFENLHFKHLGGLLMCSQRWESVSQKTCPALLCPSCPMAVWLQWTFPGSSFTTFPRNATHLYSSCHFCRRAQHFSWEPRLSFLSVSLTCRNSMQPSGFSFLTASAVKPSSVADSCPVSLPEFHICKYTSFPLFYPSFPPLNWIPYSYLNFI